MKIKNISKSIYVKKDLYGVIKFSNDGFKLVTTDFKSKQLRLWDTQSGVEVEALSHAKFYKKLHDPLIFNKKGNLLIFKNSGTKKVILYDIYNNKIFKELECNAKAFEINNDDSVLACMNTNDIVFWDIQTGNKIWIIKNGGFGAPSDGDNMRFYKNLFAYVDWHKRVCLCDMKRKQFLVNMRAESIQGKLAFSKAGTYLLSSTWTNQELSDWSHEVYKWNVEPYNEDLASFIYKKLDKSNYIALYEFTKKFYNKFDIVQKAYRDIYNAVNEADTLDAYAWYITTFGYDNDSYDWYKQNYDGTFSQEYANIKKQYLMHKQEVDEELYDDVEDEDNIEIYSWYITQDIFNSKPNNIVEALKAMHTVMYDEVKDIDTIDAYNTFIMAYPHSSYIDDATNRAYELEKEKYDTGWFGGNDESNRQARKLLLDIRNFKEQAGGRGSYLVLERMYNLAQKEFADTDAVLSLLESGGLKKLNSEFKQFHIALNKEIKDLDDPNKSFGSIFLEQADFVTNGVFASTPSKELQKFYEKQKSDAKEFMSKLGQQQQEKQKRKEKQRKDGIDSFNKIYNEVVASYKNESIAQSTASSSAQPTASMISLTPSQAQKENIDLQENFTIIGTFEAYDDHNNGDAKDSEYIVQGLDPNGDGFLSVRNAPDSSAKEIGRIYNGDSVEIINKKEKWYNIKFGNQYGWAHSNWIKKDNDNAVQQPKDQNKQIPKKKIKQVSLQGVTKIGHLMWQDDGTKIRKDWGGAKKYCSNLKLGGFDDWRLPSKRDLQKLYHDRVKLKHPTRDNYISSTKQTNKFGATSVWIISFSNGYDTWRHISNDYYIRCVR